MIYSDNYIKIEELVNKLVSKVMDLPGNHDLCHIEHLKQAQRKLRQAIDLEKDKAKETAIEHHDWHLLKLDI